MALSLAMIAQMAMDEYYQDARSNEEFFDRDDFMRHIADYYNQFLNDEFQKFRQQSKIETGFATVEVPMAWTVQEIIIFNPDPLTGEYKATTSQNFFTFRFDSFGYAVVRLLQGKVKDCEAGQPKNEFIRITVDESFAVTENILPVTPKCFYFVSGQNSINTMKKNPMVAIIDYVPMVDAENDSSVMSETLAAQCIQAVLNLKFASKKEVTIDMLNDRNRNEILQQQTNPAAPKVQNANQ